MLRMTGIALATLVVAASATAQFGDFAVSFSPNPAPPAGLGRPSNVDVTITNSTAAIISLGSPCTWFEIHAGTQTGPVIPLNVACVQILIDVWPGSSFTLTWDQIDANTGVPVPPGRYWFKTRVFGTTVIEDWFCLDVQPPNDPALTINGFAQVGQVNQYAVRAPALSNQIYGLLFSFSTNNPVVVPGFVDICLSPPWIVVRDGVLDPSGLDTFHFGLPNQPFLANQGFHFQALILDAGTGSLITTNDLSLTIAP